MSDPYAVVRQFEAALCAYTGAPYCVTTNSCTMALLLAVAYHLRNMHMTDDGRGTGEWRMPEIEIPKRTYVSVPMSIIHAGGRPTFRDEPWLGCYQLRPLPVWDSARWLTSDMYRATALNHEMLCLSFHWTKTLGIQQGGAILLDDAVADSWLRAARFDGRIEGLTVAGQAAQLGFHMVGWHCYMSPEVAAAGLVRLRALPKHNEPLPNDDYPDLSQIALFQ